MKLSDIKGERSLDVIADVMELVDEIGEDKRFDEFVAELKACKGDSGGVRRTVCSKLPPIIRDHKDRVIAVMASIADVDKKEYAKNGEVLKDLVELLTSDAEALGFLASFGSTAD